MNLHKISGTLGEYKIDLESYSISLTHSFSEIKSPLDLVSRKNPIKQTERILGNFLLKNGYLAIIFGACNLLLLKKLVQQKKEKGGIILLFENDILFLNYLKIKYHSIFKFITCISGEDTHQTLAFLDHIDIEYLLGYKIFKNGSSVQFSKQFYFHWEFFIKNQLSARLSDLFTKLEFESEWVLNSMLQIISFSKAQPIANLFGKGKNQKAILVSSGPSLRKDLETLKKLRKYYFIACVDSAYQILYEFGITPHLVFTLDCQAFTIRHFLNASWGKKDHFPILYADIVSNPNVVSRWIGPLFLGVTAQYSKEDRFVTPGVDFIEDFLLSNNNIHSLGDIQSGGSVATSLFDLLRLMEFKEIILLGQDLAYSYREIHCMGTHHNKEWFSGMTNRMQSIENINNQIIKLRKTKLQPSISGNKIIADYILSIYAKWFEDAVNRLDIVISNASSEGLHIKNIKNIPLKEKLIHISYKEIPKTLYWINKNGNTILNKEQIYNFHKSLISVPYQKDLEKNQN